MLEAFVALRIPKALCSLAKSLNTLIGATASLPKAIALGPFKCSSILIFKLSNALLANVFL